MTSPSGIQMLDISATVMGKTQSIHPTLIWDESDMILVDTSYPGQYPLLQAEIMKTGLPLEKLNKVIITHQDIDHIGGLPALLQECPSADVIADPIEKPYIEGERMLVKVTPEAIAQAVASLPPQVPEAMRAAFKHALENPPKAPVNATVSDEEELPYCGGINIIGTPGHTPGHISLYHRASKTLIAGDALNVENGDLCEPTPANCWDFDMALHSLKRLSKYEIDRVICYHGGSFTGDCNKRIAELAGE
ncbi:MBL fold metallo-hydrolase [Gorillibacterium massiliense]|uniref:MBL fold metallo-hydrolase n=1 Tax=Gorillibacterium massiliense TaxID=1280390 RepID=UPI000594B20B|nr:MBL fold metallo-hydrolase [Gorillibacterium massiliense]